MANKDNGRCLVCGDVSIGYNFGVPTCMPCKAFFRRNAVKLNTQEFVCHNDGDCIITYKYRRSCNCCRLAKCFRVGMKRSLILSDEQRQARNKLVETNRLKRGKVPKRSCSQWMQPPSLIHLTKSSCEPLSPSDQMALANIFHTYEKTCGITRNAHFQTFPVVPHTSLHEWLNEMSLVVPVFIEYFKHIPEFTNILLDDRIRLVKNHFGMMININEPLLQPVPTRNLVITWTNLLGTDISERLVKRNQIIEQYTVDPIILKVMLIILMLSGNSPRTLTNMDIDQICDDELSIFAAQNVYVELLWRYILSCSPSEVHAVKFFNKLIMCILYMKNLDVTIDNYINNFKDEIRQMEPLMQNMWPKASDEEDIIDTNIVKDITDTNIVEDVTDTGIIDDIIL